MEIGIVRRIFIIKYFWLKFKDRDNFFFLILRKNDLKVEEKYDIKSVLLLVFFLKKLKKDECE